MSRKLIALRVIAALAPVAGFWFGFLVVAPWLRSIGLLP